MISQPTHWFVVFTEARERLRWYQRPLKRGFRHVYAFGKLPGGQFWIVVDPLSDRTDAYLADDQAMRLAWDAINERGRILRVPQGRDGSVRAALVPSCVSVVKHLIGCGAFAPTPWTLYRALRRAGATRLV